MKLSRDFSPHEALAEALLPHAIGTADGPVPDGAHDGAHLLRVWKNVQAIARKEGGDGDILAAATLLHDCVDVPKDSPLRAQASRLAAEKARTLLGVLGWEAARCGRVAHAIEAHSFSAGISPETLEARILQDADRLDALGHIGIARCFHVSGRLGRALYDPDDPLAEGRALDDLTFALDHFQTKLLKLSGTFQTEAGKALAKVRHEVAQAFLEGLVGEVSAQGREV